MNCLSVSVIPINATASFLDWLDSDFANFDTVSSFLTILTHFGNKSVYIVLNNAEIKFSFTTKVIVLNYDHAVAADNASK